MGLAEENDQCRRPAEHRHRSVRSDSATAPGFKLAAKFQRDEIIKRFLASRKQVFYAWVLQEGVLQAGDPIFVSKQDSQGVSIRELTDLYVVKRPRRSDLERALAVTALAASWREHFAGLLSRTL